MTLTLQKSPGISDSHAIVLTDVSDEIAAYVQSLLPDRQILRMTHRLSPEERGADWPVRESRVVSYLNTYQAADLVITSRLHCALPSTALGTPAILIGKYDEDYQNRLSDYASYCVSVSEKDLLEHRADDTIQAILAAATIPVSDPRPALSGIQSISPLADHLAERCREYIRSVAEQEPEPSELPEPSLYRQLYVDRTAYMRRSIGQLLYRCQQYELQHIHDMTVMNQVLATAQKVFDMK